MRKALLLLAATSACAAPVPAPTPRAQAVVGAFYKAVFLTADQEADEPLAKASAFARAGMRETVVGRIPGLASDVRNLAPEEIRDILEARQGEPHRASYGNLTCLFVQSRSWVKSRKGDRDAWVQAPLDEARKEAIWRAAGHGQRRDALMALFASAFGKEVRTESASCRGCDGHPHEPQIRMRQTKNPYDDTCRSCRGVGVVESVRYR